MRIQIFQKATRLHDDAAGMHLFHRVHVMQVHDTSTGQRHGLPVIARPCPAGGDGNIMGVTGFEDFDDFGFAFGRDDKIGCDVIQPGFQHR